MQGITWRTPGLKKLTGKQSLVFLLCSKCLEVVEDLLHLHGPS